MAAPSSPLQDDIKRVGIWIRVSTEDQAKGESPEHHEKRARAYAEVKDWKVIEVYHLEGVSGKAVMHHPEAKRMLADIKSGHIGGLIFSKLARLARNTKELLEFADLFRNHNAHLISLQESIDTSTPAGRLFYTMIAAMAQWEREEIAERVAVSVPIRAKLGKPLGGAGPFGYEWKDRKLVIHPVEGPVRRLTYELFAEHQRFKTVARLLNDAGHRTRSGKKFADMHIKRFITDSTAKGVHLANYQTRGANGRNIRKPQKDWVYNPVEALVSEDLWNRCNLLINDRKLGPKPLAKKPVHLFAGLTYCHCGNKMYVPSNTPKYVCQECRHKIPMVDLEALFREQLKRFVLSPQEIAKHLQDADETLVEKKKLLDSLIHEREKVVQSMDRAFQLHMDGQMNADSFGTRYKPLEERLKQLDVELPRLEAQVDFMKINNLSQDQILSNAKDLYSHWPELPHEDKLKLVQSLAQRITVGKGEIDFELCYLPSSEEVAKGQRTAKCVCVIGGLPISLVGIQRKHLIMP